LSSSAFEEKNQETMTSQDHCCPLHLRKKPRDDDEPKGLLSSFTLEKKIKR
jgi:hypothetical protein